MFRFEDVLMSILFAGVASIQPGGCSIKPLFSRSKMEDLGKALFDKGRSSVRILSSVLANVTHFCLSLVSLGMVGVDPHQLESFTVLLPPSIQPSEWILFCQAFLWTVKSELSE